MVIYKAHRSFIHKFYLAIQPLIFGETRLFRKTIMTIAVALLIISCFYSALHLPTYAEQNGENVVVGVEVGDWIKYHFIEGGSSKEEGWIKVEVKNVSGTSIMIHILTQISNGGGYENTTINVDVKEGWIQEHPYYLYRVPYTIIPGNLSLDDYAFSTLLEKFSTSPEAKFSWNYSLNYNLVSRKYGEAVRTVLLINQSYELPFVGYVMKCQDEFYWDKVTGLLLEQKSIGYMPETAAHVTYMRLLQIADTNLWKMPQPSPPWVEITLGTTLPIAAITLIVAVQKNRNNKKQKGLEES